MGASIPVFYGGLRWLSTHLHHAVVDLVGGETAQAEQAGQSDVLGLAAIELLGMLGAAALVIEGDGRGAVREFQRRGAEPQAGGGGECPIGPPAGIWRGGGGPARSGGGCLFHSAARSPPRLA